MTATQTDLAWRTTNLAIEDNVGGVVWSMDDVLVPEHWRDSDCKIIAQKYLHPNDEGSFRKMIGRVVGAIADSGVEQGHLENALAGEEFAEDLFTIVYYQQATWNSPVWFNVGITDTPQCWACLILNVEDEMQGEDGIKAWWSAETDCFLGGSGSGVNVSKIRADGEPLRSGYGEAKGQASGPLSFMRIADAAAGAIKSGGRTRRAAKMVILDADHPDVSSFIQAKAHGERMAATLKAQGFDITLNGVDAFAIPYQNANHSVRVTDEFMRLAGEGADPIWYLRDRIGMRLDKEVNPAELLREMAEAAWGSGDPGIQFHDTIQSWHTTPSRGEIRASNPCSEYMHVDNTVCNLSSLNLKSFWSSTGFDFIEFGRVIGTMIMSMDILVGMSSYPKESVRKNATELRQLGIGYTNLGAWLMSMGIPYDSTEGRAVAASVTALLQAHAAFTSAKLAERLGPHAAWGDDRDSGLAVLARHSTEWTEYAEPGDAWVDDLHTRAREVWAQAIEAAHEHGQRNSQLSVIAPTGTISFMLGAETTGIEPLLDLAIEKELVGGGTIDVSASSAVREALEVLTHDREPLEDPAFATAWGENRLRWQAHIEMMAAVQPSISGAISKTIAMPVEATVEDVESAFRLSHERGLKAVAIYRDGSKTYQPVSTKREDGDDVPEQRAAAPSQPDVTAARRRMPGTGRALRHKFEVANNDFYLHTGFFDDGRLGEIFLRGAKDGSFLAGMMDSFATAVSLGLQYGVPLEVYADKFRHRVFPPNGMVRSDSDIKMCQSIVDYVFRWLMRDELAQEEVPIEFARVEMGGPKPENSASVAVVSEPDAQCPQCHTLALRWTGNCRQCTNCGFDEGCG